MILSSILTFIQTLADEGLGGLFSSFGEGLTSGATQMASGVKEALINLIYDGETGSRVLATPFKFLIMLAGFGVGLSLIFGLLNLVKVEV